MWYSRKTAKLPVIHILSSIAPSRESVRSERFTYDHLEEVTDKNIPFEYVRIRRVWDAEDDSLAERGAAQQLAAHYLVMGALALNKATHPESIRLWSERYTQASSEIYGSPDPELARKMLERHRRGEIEAPFETAAQLVGEYMLTKYDDVYEALSLGNVPEEIPPRVFAKLFEVGLRTLQTKDPAWNDWTIDLVENSGSLGVNKRDKKILIGAKHANVRSEQLKALFTHEVLVHGLRAVNGEKHHKLLKSGLPGYTNSEEGLGIFMEYAVTGILPERNIDRYVDIAHALGQIDGRQHTRAELLELAMARAVRRNELSPSPLSHEDIEEEVYSHVNRIYRGSQGNEHVGIFTRDIAYHVGFMNIGAYITEQLENGTSLEVLMEFILLGKFDPTNEDHIEFVREHAMRRATFYPG